MSSLKAKNYLLQLSKLEKKKLIRQVIKLQWLEKHTIKPCLDEKALKEIIAPPLSNNTVTCQIKDLAANMKTSLVS